MRLAFRCVARNGIRRFQVAEPVQRPGAPQRHRRAGPRGGGRGGRDRPDLLGQRGAHARVLRRAGGGARRLRRHGPPLPQGPGRPADADAVRELAPALRAPRRATGPSSCTATARSGSRRSSTWRACGPGFDDPPHRRRPAAARHLAARRRVDDPRTSRPRASPTGSTSRRWPRSPSTSTRSRREKGLPDRRAAGVRRRPTTTTSCPAGMVSTTRRMLEEIRRGPSCSTPRSRRSGGCAPRWATRSSSRPVSQFVATQAVRNVIDAERWANVSDETIRYFLGHYGEPAPRRSTADVADRVLSPRTRPVSCATSSRCTGRRAGALRPRGSPTRSCSCA